MRLKFIEDSLIVSLPFLNLYVCISLCHLLSLIICHLVLHISFTGLRHKKYINLRVCSTFWQFTCTDHLNAFKQISTKLFLHTSTVCMQDLLVS